MDNTLFDLPATEPVQPAEPTGSPRLQLPNRDQLELRSIDLDGLLAADHRARLVWEFVQGLDLAPLYKGIRAVEGHAGRPPIDPAILMALWLYATLDGVGSARALDRLCSEHDAYRWIAGGVGVNYHTLAAFRVDHAEVLDRLLTESVAALLADDLVTLAAVAQDGVRVRAAAGAASYRRRATLERFLAEAKTQVEALKTELEDDPGASSRRVAAARERAARERAQRVRHALEHLPELEAAKRRAAKAGKPPADARTSTTDPEARVMKMADGGYRPAYNAQFVTDTASQVIVGLDTSNQGTDHGQLGPMADQLHRRYGRSPGAWLADAGFISGPDIDRFDAPDRGATLYMPVLSPQGCSRDLHLPLPGDSPAVAAWRIRMGTPAAQEIYRNRAATAECVNAIARNRGLQRFRVRGNAKVRATLLWFALAHNLMRTVALRAEAGTA
jgi:transposase